MLEKNTCHVTSEHQAWVWVRTTTQYQKRELFYSVIFISIQSFYLKKNRKTEYFFPYIQYNTVLKKVKDKLKSKNICPTQWYPNFLCFLLRKCTTLLSPLMQLADIVSYTVLLLVAGLPQKGLFNSLTIEKKKIGFTSLLSMGEICGNDGCSLSYCNVTTEFAENKVSEMYLHLNNPLSLDWTDSVIYRTGVQGRELSTHSLRTEKHLIHFNLTCSFLQPQCRSSGTEVCV